MIQTFAIDTKPRDQFLSNNENTFETFENKPGVRVGGPPLMPQETKGVHVGGKCFVTFISCPVVNLANSSSIIMVFGLSI